MPFFKERAGKRMSSSAPNRRVYELLANGFVHERDFRRLYNRKWSGDGAQLPISLLVKASKREHCRPRKVWKCEPDLRRARSQESCISAAASPKERGRPRPQSPAVPPRGAPSRRDPLQRMAGLAARDELRNAEAFRELSRQVMARSDSVPLESLAIAVIADSLPRPERAGGDGVEPATSGVTGRRSKPRRVPIDRDACSNRLITRRLRAGTADFVRDLGSLTTP